ncbi:MAG: PEP-CTERM system TPR-repeat protein PrsT [Nitrospiraceae bacterium]|nr:PEP-CTERM system TPR-repeat protein PrsT [Nitrospiraceae bacterium]
MAVSLLSACHPKTKEELFGKGRDLLGKGDARSAIIYLKKALEKDPGYTDAKLVLARAYGQTGKYDSATDVLTRILSKDPANNNAHIELARVYLEQAKPDNASAELKKLPASASNDAQVLEETGWVYALRKDYPSAVSFLQRALQGGKRYNEIKILLAKVYFTMGDENKTRETLQDVLKKNPANEQAIQLMATVQVRANDIDGAIKTYSMAGKSDFEAQFREGLLFIGKGRQDQAMKLADNLISGFKYRPEGFMLKGLSLCELKRYNDAIVFLRKSLEKGETAQAHYYLGLCLYNLKEPEQALTELNRAAGLNPAFAQAKDLAGLILLKQKRVDDAIRELKGSMGNGQGDALTHNLLGNAYMAKDMYNEALDELGRSISMDPSLPDSHFQKGLMLVSKDKIAEGESELKKAVSLESGMPKMRILLASLYERQKDDTKALDVLTGGIKGQKTDAPLYNMMAEIHARKGDLQDCEADLKKAKSADPDYPGSYFSLASFYAQTGQAGKALQELETLCQRTPGNTRALIGAAALLEAKGDNAGALKYYTLALNTGQPEGFFYYARYELKAKKTSAALSTLDNGIAKNPSAIQLYQMKGGLQMGSKDFGGAISTYSALEKINPELGVDLLAKAYLAMNRPADALQIIKRELAQKPGDIGLLVKLSTIYGIMGNKSQALSTANQIIAADPGSPAGYIQLASIQSRDSVDNAIRTLSGPRVPKDGQTGMMLGSLYFSKKNYRLAENEFRMAEQAMPGYSGPVYRQGVALQVMGKEEQAMAEYRRVLEMDPVNVAAMNNLAYLYASGQGKKPSFALRLASRAYALAPQSPDVMDTYGFTLLKNGKAADALKILEKSSALMPNNPSITYHLASAYAENGDTGMAIGALRKCFKLGDFPESRQARALLAKLEKSGASTGKGFFRNKPGHLRAAGHANIRRTVN